MRALALVIALVAGAPAALAQTSNRSESRADPTAESDCARAKRAGRACTLDFEGDQVGGERAGGLGEWLPVRDRARFTSLLRIRASFRGEIIRTTDEL